MITAAAANALPISRRRARMKTREELTTVTTSMSWRPVSTE
jgi:hypothetical protein